LRPRPARRARSAPSIARRRARRRIGALGWGVLGTSVAVVAAVTALAFLHPDLLSQTTGLSSSQLVDMARSLRALLGR
jgi:hypothetical protein